MNRCAREAGVGAGWGRGKVPARRWRCPGAPRCRRCLRRGLLCLRRSSASIYISGARCPMARAEPIRWQIRCQLGGSCRETVAASLPPQFKFPTWRAEETRTLLQGSRPAAGIPPAPRRAAPERRCAAPAAPRPSRLPIDRIHPSIDRRSYRAGAEGCESGDGGLPQYLRPFADAKDFSLFFFPPPSFFVPFFFLFFFNFRVFVEK